MTNMEDCGLCSAYEQDWRTVARNDKAVAVTILNPINEGHIIIVPRRHVLSLDELSDRESKALNEILYKCQQSMLIEFPIHPPIFTMQVGKHQTQSHIHYQMFPSDAHVRQMYGAAHNNGMSAMDVNRKITHPDYDRDKLIEISERLRRNVPK